VGEIFGVKGCQRYASTFARLTTAGHHLRVAGDHFYAPLYSQLLDIYHETEVIMAASLAASYAKGGR
jgi:hypothetical protein